MTGRYKLNEVQTDIVITLLDKRAQIDAQIGELVGMLCRQYGVDDDWLLFGNRQDGFALVPPEEALPDETDS